MKKILAIGLFLAGIQAAVVLGENAAELKAKLKALDERAVTERRESMRAPELIALREASAVAEKAYQEAVSAIPEVQELDRQIAALREQMRDLMKKRADAVEAAKPTLSAELQASETARTAYTTAMRRGSDALLKERRELSQRLAELEAQERKPAGEEPAGKEVPKKNQPDLE